MFIGAFGGNQKTALMRGFECDCLPGQMRRQHGTPLRIILTCEGLEKLFEKIFYSMNSYL